MISEIISANNSDDNLDLDETLRVRGVCVDHCWVPSPVCRLEDEKRARKELEKDVEDLKKTNKDTKLNCKQTQKEIDLVKEELDRLKQEHKEVRLERKTLQDQLIKLYQVKSDAKLLLRLL